MVENQEKARSRAFQITFALAAIASLLIGLMVYLFAEEFGLDEWTAKLLATAFLIAGVVDYVVLRLWDRIRIDGR